MESIADKYIQVHKRNYDKKPIMPKKFKSLDEAYTNMYKISAVRIDEDAEITGTLETGKEEFVGVVDDSYYDLLKKNVAARESGGIYEMVDELLEVTGWKKGKKYKEDIFTPVVNIFINSGISREFTSNLLHTHKTNPDAIAVLPPLLKSNRIFNVKDNILSKVTKLSKTNENQAISYLIENLWNVNPTISTVGTGKSEVCLTLLSNAEKGKTGDLFIEGIGEIEVKANEGRPGSVPFAHPGAATKLYNILKNKNKNIGSVTQLRALKNSFLTKKANYELATNDARNLIIKDIEAKKIDPIILDQFEKVIKYVNGLLSEDFNNIDVEKIVNDVRNNLLLLPQPYIKILRRLLITKDNIFQKKSVIDTETHNIFNTNISDTKNIKNGFLSFVKSVKNFFLIDWGLTKEELIDGVIASRNDPLDAAALKKLKNELNDFFAHQDIEQLKDPKFLSDMIIALHNMTYYLDHGFAYILLVNDESKNGFSIDCDDSGNLFENLFNQIHSVDISTGLDVDNRSKGVTMTLRA